MSKCVRAQPPVGYLMLPGRRRAGAPEAPGSGQPLMIIYVSDWRIAVDGDSLACMPSLLAVLGAAAYLLAMHARCCYHLSHTETICSPPGSPLASGVLAHWSQQYRYINNSQGYSVRCFGQRTTYCTRIVRCTLQCTLFVRCCSVNM
jgi:hypothetical protein